MTASKRRFLCLGFGAIVALSLQACAMQTVVIYERTTRYGTIVVTEDDRGLRTLQFARGGARQSVVRPDDPDHLELAYARFALVGLALCVAPQRILVIGLGGGTLPGFLHKHYPNTLIDVAELNPDVVDVAKQFFGFREDALMRVHVGDARSFIERVRQPSYDMIFLDAFGPSSVPPHLTTQEFLQAVRRALRPGGVVVGNVWNRSANALHDAMLRTYQEVFEELFVLDVAGEANRILLVLPRQQPMSRSDLAQRARQVSAAKQFRFDLGDLVDSGFALAYDWSRAERVLRDADVGRSK